MAAGAVRTECPTNKHRYVARVYPSVCRSPFPVFLNVAGVASVGSVLLSPVVKFSQTALPALGLADVIFWET